MSKKMETKKEIMRMLSNKSRTMTDLSRELELAPSTVNQHLVDLKIIGAIQQVDNFHVRKWKYYTVSPMISKFQF
jgi:predicted transcriptional regulator